MSDHVLAEIARLTGAIAEHKSSTSSHSSAPHQPRRGGRGRGNKFNNSTYSTTTHRNTSWVAPGRATSSSSSTPSNFTSSSRPPPPTARGYRNQTLVLNGPGATSTSIDATGTSSSGTATPQPKPAPPPLPPKQAVEVIIGGATFVADPRGNKLVRKPGPPSTPRATTTNDSPSTSTPKRTSVSGTTYIRTKSGNLVSRDFARQRKEATERRALALKKERLDALVGIVKDVQGAREGETSASVRGGRGRGRGKGRGGFARPTLKKSSKLCRFFQKTGQCTRGLTCPFIHSSLTVSICPLFLRSKCPLKPSLCPLSHTPTPQRSPHCLHFPHCTRPSCPYAHVVVDRDALVCRAFVEYGWCDKGEECRLRHAVECPEFSERGTCGRVGCKLPHILRRRNEDGVEDDEEEDDEEGEGEELAEGEIQWEATKPSKRGRRASDALGGEVELEPGEAQGISGSAGWALKSKKAKRRAHDLDANNDFVTLSIPLEDDDEEDDDEDSDNESVDSADLDDDEGSQLSREGSAPGDHEDVDEQLEAADAPSEASEITLPSASVDVDMPVAVAVESDDSEEDGEGDEEVEKLLRY